MGLELVFYVFYNLYGIFLNLYDGISYVLILYNQKAYKKKIFLNFEKDFY